MKNIAQKLQEARVKVEVVKTGLNKFGGYNFYQIDVIYAEAKKIFAELGIITVNRTEMFELCGTVYKKFIMDVINSDNLDDKVTYDVIAEPNKLKGCQQAQEAGSDITYNVKYLFGLALMLDDGKSDVDATNTHDKSDAKSSPKKSATLSRAELINKVKELPQDKQLAYGQEYASKEGKTALVSVTYWKGEFLNDLASREGWIY